MTMMLAAWQVLLTSCDIYSRLRALSTVSLSGADIFLFTAWNRSDDFWLVEGSEEAVSGVDESGRTKLVATSFLPTWMMRSIPG